MTIDLITLKESADTLVVSVTGSESSLQMIIDHESLSCYGGAPQVEGSSEKCTTPTGTKSSKRISTAFWTYTTILSAPRDPDSMSRGFDLRLEGSTGRADHTIC